MGKISYTAALLRVRVKACEKCGARFETRCATAKYCEKCRTGIAERRACAARKSYHLKRAFAKKAAREGTFDDKCKGKEIIDWPIGEWWGPPDGTGGGETGRGKTLSEAKRLVKKQKGEKK